MPFGDENVGQVTHGQALLLSPTPRTRLRLGTLKEVKRELIKVYWEARYGTLPTATATRLAFLLNMIGNTIKDAELEQRIEALEKSATVR